MELKKLKAQIIDKKLDKFYVFTGPERQVMKIYIEQMAKAVGADIKTVDCITDLLPKSRSTGLVRGVHIYVLYESKEFISDDSVRELITSKNTFRDCILLFIYGSLDKRSKVCKTMSENIVEFDTLTPAVLKKYVSRDIHLNDKNVEKLMDICENDYSRILLEIDKILTYKKYLESVHEETDDDRAFATLLHDGTIYRPPYDAVFDFVDAVLSRKKSKSFFLLKQSYDSGEATLVLLSNLYTGAKGVLQVQTCSSDNVCEATGLTPFQAKLAKGRVGNYSVRELINLMKLTRKIERGIKVGEIEDGIAVESLLAMFWG